MRVLLATASVHTTAAACDYLGARLDDADAVVAVTVAGDGPARDGEDALNVVRVRLPGPRVETERLTGNPGEEILAAAVEHEVDEIVIGARSGAPGADPGIGNTARHVLANAGRPVVVVPLS